MGVNPHVQCLEGDSFLGKVIYQRDDVIPIPAKAEKAGHNDSIPLPEFGKQLIQGGAGGGQAADPVLEDLLASRFMQGFNLRVQLLVQCGDPGIAKNFIHRSKKWVSLIYYLDPTF